MWLVFIGLASYAILVRIACIGHERNSLQTALLPISSVGDESFGKVIFYVAAACDCLGTLSPPTTTSLATLFVGSDEIRHTNDSFGIRCSGGKAVCRLHIGGDARFGSRPVHFPVHPRVDTAGVRSRFLP